MRRQDRTSKGAWLFAGIWGLVALVITIPGLLHLEHQRTLFRQSVLDQLSAIADTKVQQILDWRKERLQDAKSLMADPFLPQAVQQLLADPSNPELRAWLLTKLKATCAESQSLRALLLDPQLGVQAAFPENKTYFGPGAGVFAQQAMLSNQVVVSDLHRSRFSSEIHFDVAIPLQLPGPPPGPTKLIFVSTNAQTIAVIDLEDDPSKFLYPLMQSWPIPSRTAETLLVRREGDDALFLNELRHRKQTALAFRLPLSHANSPATLALLGREGAVEGVDYRGEPVLAAVRAVPGTPWKLVAKIDRQEAFVAFRRQSSLTLAVILGLVLIVGLASWVVWRHAEARRLVSELSERKRTEAELARERDLLRALLENTPDAIYFKDLQSRFVRCSHSFKALFDVNDLGLIAGKTDFDFFAAEHAQQAHEDEQEVMRTGKPMICKQEQETHSDGRITWALTSKMPWRDGDGRIIGTFGISKDITVMKEAETVTKQAELERQAMETQLRQAQKLEAVGQLAAGIAHEINTPTQYIGDNTRFLQDSFQAVKKAIQAYQELLSAVQDGQANPALLARVKETLATCDLEYLLSQIPPAISETLEGVGRVTKIVRAMKEFSHPGGKEKVGADLNHAIETTVTVARNEWKYVAEVSLELDPLLPPVPCFLGEFHQAVLNLVVNAAHAIADAVRQRAEAKGIITIRTRHMGDQVEVRVTDTGTGIPEAARPHIFEPFFTTKAVGKGTGQGLSFVYGCVVKRHGGAAAFESEVGKGTTFILRLPLAPRAPDIPAGESPDRVASALVLAS